MIVSFSIAFLLCYFLYGLGITIGYHRLLSHRSHRCPKVVEYFWMIAGYLTFSGSPARWAAIHRAHHDRVETFDDPHSPRNGYGHAYISMWSKQDLHVVNVQALCSDLLKDPIYKFLETGGVKLSITVNLLFQLSLGLILGWSVALASILAAFVVLQLPSMINLFCHLRKFGYRNFKTENDAVNVWWLALLTFGDGWHNNHHVFPNSARSGLAPQEFDLAWHVINLERDLGLASHLYQPSINEIVKNQNELMLISPVASRSEILKATAKHRANPSKKLFVT